LSSAEWFVLQFAIHKYGDKNKRNCSFSCCTVLKLCYIEGGTWLRVFESKVLWKIFEPEREDVTEAWRCLHDEELYELHSSSNIIRGIKFRRMRWAGRVIHVGDRRGA